MDAFDSKSKKSPSPFFTILNACKQIEDMGVLSENTPLLLGDLAEAIENFSDEHPSASEQANWAISSLTELIVEFSNEEFSKENAKQIKEKVSYVVQYFFQLLEDEQS